MSDLIGGLMAATFAGILIKLEQDKRQYRMEHFSDGSEGAMVTYPRFPQNQMFYGPAQARANALYNQQYSPDIAVQSNNAFAGPEVDIPISDSRVSLEASGSQQLSYQLYQNAVNAATPTMQQLDSISGNSYQQTGNDNQARGGVSQNFAPYNILGDGGPELYNSEYQAVNVGNERAQQISSCSQNAPTFVATSLLPKPVVPGSESWNMPNSDILANQNFLAATQQIGVDTVLGSLRNASYDIRNNIPNPINVISPWNQSTITPDLERRPLDTFIPTGGVYGCGPSGCNVDGTYVGMSD